MFVRVAALSRGQRPGYFGQPARASGSGLLLFRQSAQWNAFTAGAGITGDTVGFGQAAYRKVEG